MVFNAFFCFCLWLLGGVPDVYTDETVMISVMEGDSVVLNTDVTELQKDDHILWSFRLNSSETRIAQSNTQIISIYDSGENEIFRDRLQIDEQTGSLTITNINKLHSGLYKLQIISRVIKHISFSIGVYGILPVPVIIRDSSQNFSSSSGSAVSTCSLLCSVVNVGHVTLSWYKGNSLLSNNPIRNQTKHLDISQLCQPSSESNQTSLLLVVLLLLLLLLVVPAVVVLICRRRNYTQAKQEAQNNEEEVDYTDATFIKHRDQDMGANGHDRTVYSEVALRR